MRDTPINVVKANKHIREVSDKITHLNLYNGEDIKYFMLIWV